MDIDNRNKEIEKRYRELWREGYRANVIFHTLATEFNLSFHTIQKMLDVRKLKKELTK